MRRAPAHPFAPVCAAVAVGLVYLALEPATADMAAHVYRTGLWSTKASRSGTPSGTGAITCWATLLFSPLAAWFGPRLIGVAAEVAAVALFGRVVGARHRASAASWLFGAGGLALAATWASPVAGAFLALAAGARRLGGGAREPPAAAVLAGPVVAGGAVLVVAFPEGGPDRFAATAFWPMLAVSLAGAALLDPRRARWRPERGCTWPCWWAPS